MASALVLGLPCASRLQKIGSSSSFSCAQSKSPCPSSFSSSSSSSSFLSSPLSSLPRRPSAQQRIPSAPFATSPRLSPRAALTVRPPGSIPRTAAADVIRSQEYDDSTLQYLEEQDTFSKFSGYVQRSTAGASDGWDRYDPTAMAQYFRSQPFLVSRRLAQIASVLGVWLAKRWLDEKTGRGDENFKMRAAELRAALVQLGPAYVKVAQAVSSRPDVVPPVYLEQLSLLQDRIAPFSTALALDMIEEELGVPVESLFSEISPLPVAAASLGQVYQARLAANGQAVAVKVQRPGVRAVIALDIYILRILAGWFRQSLKLNTDLQAVLDEWASSLFLEMDYEREAQNGIRFRELFGKEPGVVIPRVFPELTTQRVLMMEWVEGERLTDVRDINLVEIGVEFSLTQLLDSGFYHADPHPGNLLRTPDGRLAYLDFGMMGEMELDVREALIRASVHLVNREFDALAQDLVALQLLPRGQETGQVADALTSVFRDAISTGVRNIKFGDLGAELGRTMYRFQFRIPPYFSLVVRSLTVLEGIALKSNPNYKILASSYPWIARKVLTDSSPQLRATLKELLYQDGRLRVERLESLLNESTKKVSVSGGSTLPFGGAPQELDVSEEEKRRTQQRVLSFALSKEGAFVREILVEEVAKGIDSWGRMILDSAIDATEERLPQTVLGVLPPIPLLADAEDDSEHADNLRRLLALAARSQGMVGPTAGAAPEAGSLFPWDNPAQAVQSLGEAVSHIPAAASLFLELPREAQQQAVLLPADVAGRLVSRAFARTIRQVVKITNNASR